MPLYDRGDAVRVRVSHVGSAWLRARVMVDLGGDTLIVARTKPGSTKRVPRDDVQRERPIRRKPAPQTQTKEVDVHRLWLCDSPHGTCALQRQARKPTKSEMAAGMFSFCATWVQSRSSAARGEPTCPKCRSIVGLEM